MGWLQTAKLDPLEYLQMANMKNNTQSSASDVRDRSIGNIIAEANKLSPEQVGLILEYQKSHGVRFGEAAVALGLAKGEDVLWALSQQFHYPYATGGENKLGEELVLAHKPFSHQAEAIRTLRSQLNMRIFTPDQPRRAVAIVSPESGDGKTFFAANLAIAFSQIGGRTLLIDADMRNPRLHHIFNIDMQGGLSGILSGRAESGAIRAISDLPSLFLMPVGTVPPNPTELLERPAFGLLMQELVNKFDYIFVDTPAAEFGSDYAVIAARCGASLTIVRKNHSRVDSLKGMNTTIAAGASLMAGVVLNEHR
ncbi:polysaccharide biosynthesis tyrosine autokinase [Roseateles sp. BYS180W]|uniref:Polysaccharide biosynthesis tyrosine autokinase n=1 Tax=Roseateles rivi TaxID=3299028 RepID=A0ABW7FSL6_9BURK